MNTSIINKLGVDATAFAPTLKRAGLDWEVKEDMLQGSESGVPVHRMKMLYRSDTKEALGVVGQDYTPTSPKEFLESQYQFAEYCGGKVMRTGFISERSRAFAFIEVNQVVQLPKEAKRKGDVTKAYIYSIDGWDGGTPRKSKLFFERLWCANGMSMLDLEGSLWVAHTKNSKARFGKKWEGFLGEVKQKVASVQDRFAKLVKERMTPEEATKFLETLYPGEGAAAEERRAKILGLFSEGDGNKGETRWDVFNAVTQYVTHEAPYRDSGRAPQNVNQFLGVLKSPVYDRAMGLLLN